MYSSQNLCAPVLTESSYKIRYKRFKKKSVYKFGNKFFKSIYYTFSKSQELKNAKVKHK
jgi:hypothetical protein